MSDLQPYDVLIHLFIAYLQLDQAIKEELGTLLRLRARAGTDRSLALTNLLYPPLLGIRVSHLAKWQAPQHCQLACWQRVP